MLKKLVALATLAASLSFAAGGLVPSTNPTNKPSSKKLWWVSVAALAGASVLDARSSWGRHELNPLLQGPNGQFSARSVEIKSAIVGVGLAFQWVALRHHSQKAEKPLAIVNLAAAGLTTGAAVHNLR
ncbi:MAG TPA: hypothetical protein VN893_15260 [Bryobacteraceae bacterium]|jgi:hypothetical protein|nr:hypothetical protein [Bryobacteraceae bacterium]